MKGCTIILLPQEMNKINLLPHQQTAKEEILNILRGKSICYLNGETRSGKSLTVLFAAEDYGAKKVIFITKKKAISSIESDFEKAKLAYNLTVINYESVHKIEDKDFDFLIIDEAHNCFLGNTLIDGVKIKDINLGDSIKSFNFKKQCYEKKKVTNVFKNKLTENLIKIKCNGKEIVCTESHKIFTKRGLVKAKDILPSDELQVV